jgi:lysozyme
MKQGIDMTKFEAAMTKTTTGVSAVGVTLPAWWPTLEGASNVAVLLVPILSALWLLVQIVTFARKNWRAYHAADDGYIGRRGSLGIVVGGVLTATLSVGQWAYTSAWEGYENCVYLDVGGYPTVGVGHMDQSLKLGDCYSDKQIMQWFWDDMATKVDKPLSQCITHENLPENTLMSIRDWTFNVGGGAACKSTLVRFLNAGDLREACEQLPRWVYVRSIVVAGLENRRWRGLPGMPPSNRQLCLSGLT